MRQLRQETGDGTVDRRRETKCKRREIGDVRQEMCDRRHETGDVRQNRMHDKGDMRQDT